MIKNIIILLFLLNVLVYPQNTWTKVFQLNSWPYSLIETNDDGFLISGNNFTPQMNMVLTKTDSEGDYGKISITITSVIFRY